MNAYLKMLAWTASALATIVVASALRPVPSRADSVLPFTPPPAWKKMPEGKSLGYLHWAHGSDTSFVVAVLPNGNGSSYATELTTLARGHRSSFATYRSCGFPAKRITVASGDGVLVVQLQAVDGGYALLAYSHRERTATPEVTALLSHFCGVSSLASADAPARWSTASMRSLGYFQSPSGSSLVAFSLQPPGGDLAREVKNFSRNLKLFLPNMEVRDATPHCGRPALLLEGMKAEDGSNHRYDVEITQSSQEADLLVYESVATATPEPEAKASLASLCLGAPGTADSPVAAPTSPSMAAPGSSPPVAAPGSSPPVAAPDTSPPVAAPEPAASPSVAP